MANFWDEYNQRAQQSALSGGIQDWGTFEKMRRIQELSKKREETAKQPEEKGNFLTNLIPTAGGVGGALGGAALGATVGSAVPVVGTAVGGLLGAILGGAGGSAIGKVGENAVEGEKDLGKGVGEEAFWGGVTSVPFLAGGKVAKAAYKGATGATDAAQQAIKEAGVATIPRRAAGLREMATQPATPGAADRQFADMARINKLLTSAPPANNSIGNFALRQTEREKIDAINSLARKSAFGRNTLGLSVRDDIAKASSAAEDALQFNRLAKENVERLAEKASSRGIPIQSSGVTSGVMLTPGVPTSFAREGIEYVRIPEVPNLPSRYSELSNATPSAYPQFADEAVELQRVTARDSAQVGASEPIKRLNGKLSNWGVDAQRRVANTGKVSDSFSQEKAMVDTLNRNGLTGSATNMYKQVDSRLGELSGDINQRLAAVKAVVPRSDAIQSLRANAAKSLPGDATYEKELTRSLERLSKDSVGNITPTELFGFKQELGKRLSPAFDKINRGAPLNVKEEADMALWRSIDQDITKLAPEVKDLTRDQSQLINLRPALQASSNRTVGIPILGVKSQRLEQVKQAAQNRAGAKMSGVSAPQGQSIAPGQTIPGTFVRQSLGNTAADTFNTEDPQKSALTDIDEEIALLDNELTSGVQGMAAAEDPFMGLTEEQLAQGMVSALAAGDTKAFEQMQDLYGVMATMKKSKNAAEKPLSAEAARTVGNANTGLTSLAQLRKTIADQGGSVSPATLIPFREAFGNIGANALGTAGYDAATKNIADVITRLRTGAAITKEEASHYMSMLPQAFDSPEVIDQKLSTFEDLFSSVSNRTGVGSDLETLLSKL